MTGQDRPVLISRGLPGPDDIARRELSNGIVVLSRANLSSPSVSVQGYLQAGSLYEPDAQLGLAGFTSSALLRGTQHYTFQQIFDRLESNGASLSIGSGVHTASFHARSLVEDLDLILELLAEALQTPTFPGEHVERLRAMLLAALAIRDQDTGEVAGMLFERIVYPDHPYGRPEDGTPATINSISCSDLEAFHADYYGPRGMVIAVSGGIEPWKAIDRVEAALGGWCNPRQPPLAELPALKPLSARVRRKAVVAGKSQADIVVGAAGPRRADEDYLPASIGNNILGQFGMMGRIGESVREKAGLAYYAGSSLGAGLGPGPWDVSAGVDPRNIDRAIDLILVEIARFISEPVSAGELADTKANYIGRLPLSLESNGGVAGALLNLERYHLGLDYYQRYPELVGAVGAEQILEAARGHLNPDRLAIAVAGP